MSSAVPRCATLCRVMHADLIGIYLSAEDDFFVEEIEEDVSGPSTGGDFEELSVVDEAAVAGADGGAHPVIDAALPSDELLVHLGQPLALIDFVSDGAHLFEGQGHQLPVAVLGVRVFEQLGQLQRVLADLLYGGQEEGFQWKPDHTPEQAAGFQEAQAAHVVFIVELLHLQRGAVLVVAVRRVDVEFLDVLDEAATDDALFQRRPVE